MVGCFGAVYGGLAGSIYATGNEDTLRENPSSEIGSGAFGRGTQQGVTGAVHLKMVVKRER